jgi:hypothetical protein
MRQHKTLTPTLLILFIINFALAAPVPVRERPEARIDANVRRNVAAASQKWLDSMDLRRSPDVPVSDHAPLPSPDGSPDLAEISSQMADADRLWSSIGSDPSDWGGSPSVPVPDHAPPPSPDLADIWSQMAHADTHPPTLDRLWSSIGSGPSDWGGSPSVPMPDHAPPPSPDLADILSRIPPANTHLPTLDNPWSPIGSDPLNWGGSPSVPVPDHAPPGMDSTSWSELTPMFEMAGHRYTDGTQPAPDIPGSVPGSHLPPPPSSSHLSQLRPSEGHFPSQPHSSPNSDTSLGLMQMFGMAGHGYTDNTQPAPDIPGSVSGSLPSPPTFSPQLSQLEPTEGPFPSISNWLEMQVYGMTGHGYTDSTQPAPGIPGSDSGSRLPVGSMPVAGSLPPPPPASPHLNQLGPSEGRFPSPPDFSVNPGTLSSVGSTGGQPAPPQSPGALDPEIHSLWHPELIPSEFLENLLKGRIKRRISGSDAVY